MKCPYCGRENDESTKFCMGCGNNISENKALTKTDLTVEKNSGGSNSKIIIIIVAILVLVGIIVGVFLLTQNGSKNSNNEENSNSESEGSGKSHNELLNNVSIDLYCEKEGDDCLVKFTNNNDEAVSFIAKNITFLSGNEDEDFTSSNPRGIHTLAPGRSFYSVIWAGYDDVSIYKNCTADLSWISDIKVRDHIDKLLYSAVENKDKKQITVSINSNADEDLDSVEIYVLFYKGNEYVASSGIPVYFHDENDNPIEEFEKGKEYTGVVNYPKTKDYKSYIDFDRFEVVVNEAFKVYSGMENYR